jgi:hypothetical protein
VTRIAKVKPHPISVPLKDPVWTAHEELTSSSVIVVEVRTDDGLTGYGQIHGSPMKAICTWVERFGSSAAWTRSPMSRCHFLPFSRLGFSSAIPSG